MTDKEILEMLEDFKKKQEDYYRSLPNGYKRAKAKGKRNGLEMAIFQVGLAFLKRGSI